jgi:hypothetical protein
MRGFDVTATGQRVNQRFGKLFLIYELNEKWNADYIPLGLGNSWDAPRGDD